MLKLFYVSGITITILSLHIHMTYGQDATFFFEDFDSVTAPEMPEGWLVEGNWRTGTASPSPASGHNNLTHSGTEGFAQTPIIDLTDVSAATLTYLVRRTSTYDQDSLRVLASFDGGVTFPIVLLDAGEAMGESNGYVEINAELPSSLLNQSEIAIRFDAGQATGIANVRIDDIAVTGDGPLFLASPDPLIFTTLPNETQERTLTVTNAGTESVTVDNVVISGSAFSLASSSGGTLQPGDSIQYSVTFEPIAEGSYTGSIEFTHNGPNNPTEVSLFGSTAAAEFGFSEESSLVIADPHQIAIPLKLEYLYEVPLQGLQFTIAMDEHPEVSFTGVSRGSAVSDEGSWHLSHNISEGSMRVLLLSTDGSSLDIGTYDPLIMAQLDATTNNGNDLIVDIEIDEVIGSLAVATGDDADVAVGIGSHTLTVAVSDIEPEASETSLDFGTVIAGQTATLEVTITNPDEHRSLTITSISSDNSLFTALPESITIGPEAFEEFSITFAPTHPVFGLQDGTVTFAHDGSEDGEVAVSVTGLGAYGRGDADGDGMVDVLDLIMGIDFALEIGTPSDLELAALDLFPFSDGDGALDVRDLTVLVHGLLNGEWPDGFALPVTFEQEEQLDKWADYEESIELIVTYSPDGATLSLRNEAPMRAFQALLQGEHVRDIKSLRDGHGGATVQAGYRDREEAAALLFYRLDGRAIEPGTHAVAFVPADDESRIEKPYVTAVGSDGNRIPVIIRSEVSTDVAPGIDLPEQFHLDIPFPNPFNAASFDLQIPVAVPDVAPVRITVFDVTGRQVASLFEGVKQPGFATVMWDGRDARGHPVAAGLYLLRMASGDFVSDRKLIVVN